MLSPGYYAARKNMDLVLGARRVRLKKHDWLVTDGDVVGVFDSQMLDWIQLRWNGGPAIALSEVALQLEDAVEPVRFQQLERRVHQLIDVDGAALPDMPRPSLNALEQYLRQAQRTMLAYAYER